MSSERFNYQVVENWALGPQGRAMDGVVPGVAVDSRGRVFVADTASHTICCFNPEGTLIQTWGIPGTPGAPETPPASGGGCMASRGRPSAQCMAPSDGCTMHEGRGSAITHTILTLCTQ